MPTIPEAKAERLFNRAMLILDRRANGFGEPILWHLALRRYGWGMTEFARRLGSPGKIADGWSADGLNYRAWRAGNDTAAWNMAMTCFNRRDLVGYRRWLRRAAKTGNHDATESLPHFETRLPHGVARDIRRGRLALAHDGYWNQRRVDRRRTAMTGKNR